MPSAWLICLSFIGQSRPQGKVSWFSHPCEKAHSLLRTEVPYSALPTPEPLGWGNRSAAAVGPLLRAPPPTQTLVGTTLSWVLAFDSLKCLGNSAVSTAGGWRLTALGSFCL